MFAKETYTAESIITETPSINHRQFLGQFSKNQYYLNSQEIDRFENFEQRRKNRINRIRILFLVTKRLDGNSSLWINRQDVFYAWNIIYSKRLFSRVWNPMIGARRSAIGGDTGIKGGKAGHLAPISLNRIFNPVPLSAVCRVVYCLTCTRPDCTIRGTTNSRYIYLYTVLRVHARLVTTCPRRWSWVTSIALADDWRGSTWPNVLSLSLWPVPWPTLRRPEEIISRGGKILISNSKLIIIVYTSMNV